MPSNPRRPGGRRVQFDERSRLYGAVRSTEAAKPIVTRRWWPTSKVNLDQGVEGACTGFAVCHAWNAIMTNRKRPQLKASDAVAVYKAAKKLDAWPGEDYDGTSVLAALKAARARKLIESYRWGFGIDQVLHLLSYVGPVVIGVNWYTGMMEPDAKGYLHPTGVVEGGHATLLAAISAPSRRVEVVNSWGEDWGRQGNAYMTFDALDLLLRQDGEAVVPDPI